MSRRTVSLLIATLLIFLLYVWGWFGAPNIEIKAKWITSKVICPENIEVESIVLLEPKGYRTIVFLRKDPKLLEHLEKTKNEIVSYFVESRRSGEDFIDAVEYPVSLAEFRLDKSWVLDLRNKKCLLGDIEGHKKS